MAAVRTVRFYSVHVLADPPYGTNGLSHHRDCPCCRYRERLEHACRSAYGMRKAGLSDSTIDTQLRLEGYGPELRDDAVRFVNTCLDRSALTHHWHGASDPAQPTPELQPIR